MSNIFKPYYAVIFTSIQKENIEGYGEMAMLMEDLAKEQVGFLGIDSARNEVGITVSYWENLEAITAWKRNAEHRIAQQKGRTDWYRFYNVKICKVEREYRLGERV